MKEVLNFLALLCCVLAAIIFASLFCQIIGSSLGLCTSEKSIIERGEKIFFVLAILSGLFFFFSRSIKNPSIK